MMTDCRILILDDEIVIARDLQRILKRMGIGHVEVTNSSEEILELYLDYKPHLILCDINLEEPVEDGITVCTKILNELKTNIIFITAHSDKAYLERASKLSPLNYLLKPFDEKQVTATIEMALSKPLVRDAGCLKPSYSTLLTESEYTILKLIADNKTTSEIAEQLFISPKTVENHRRNITRKLGLQGKNNSLLSWAIEHRSELN